MKRVERVGADMDLRRTRVEFSDHSALAVSKAAARAVAPYVFKEIGIEFILPDGRRIPADLAETPKAQTSETPRVTVEKGDLVEWGTGSRGRVVAIDEGGESLCAVACVEIEGWYWHVGDKCYTREDTGCVATLEIRASDLRRVGG